MLSGKKTYLVAAASILGAVSAVLAGSMTWAQALAVIVPAILGATVRNGVSSEVAKLAAKATAPALLALALCIGVGCAAPASSQGTAGQGGSTGAAPMVVVNIGTGGGISTTNTAAPTAAPSAASTATSSQSAEASPKVDGNLGDSAIRAATGIPTLGAAVEKKPAPKPEPAPAPLPTPAPTTEPVK